MSCLLYEFNSSFKHMHSVSRLNCTMMKHQSFHHIWTSSGAWELGDHTAKSLFVPSSAPGYGGGGYGGGYGEYGGGGYGGYGGGGYGANYGGGDRSSGPFHAYAGLPPPHAGFVHRPGGFDDYSLCAARPSLPLLSAASASALLPRRRRPSSSRRHSQPHHSLHRPHHSPPHGQPHLPFPAHTCHAPPFPA